MSESAKNRENCDPKKGLTFDVYYGLEKAKEIKQKLREAFLGGHHTLETIEKMVVAHLGEKKSNWQGGITNLPYPFEFNEEFKTLIRERDNHTCQLCGRTKEEEGGNLCVHHIYYDKENSDMNPERFTALCNRCNTKVNFNREYWTEFFQQKMELNFCAVD